MMKRIVIIGGGLVLLVCGLWWISGISASTGQAPDVKPKRPAPLVAVQEVVLGDISTFLELTGSVEPTRVARLASPAEGPIINCAIREGDTVGKGNKLLSIGRKKATEALLKSAKSEVDYTENELERIQTLVESGAIPRDQLELTRAQHAKAIAQMEKMEESARDFDVVAPWDGIVSKVLVTDGNYVAARSALVEIFDPKSLVVRVAVPEVYSQSLKKDMSVSVELDAYEGKVFRGSISRIYPELDRRMRTQTAEVELLDAVKLVPGMFARLVAALRTEEGTIVVPGEAIIVTPKGDRVAYVIQEDRVQRREISTGLESKGKVQILSGLKPGEQVVVAGNEKLKDGTRVRLKKGQDQKVPKKSELRDGPACGGAVG
ncbi:MAG: efflux RND transporter periplasmic adaptor subunit [Desulfomonilaceae bacterium]|nr:efflux RND transporter periplasmic adaptor subunit [Desulfomonilaceae bacterium]